MTQKPAGPRAPLHACPSCSRHIRVSEPACPFCGGDLSNEFHAMQAPVPIPIAVRLSRAAIVALGTGSISLVSACGAATGSLLPPIEDGGGEGDTGSTSPPDASEGFDVGTIAPPYGIAPPPPFDAGRPPPVDAGRPPVDASHPDVVIAPPYGAPVYGAPPGPGDNEEN